MAPGGSVSLPVSGSPWPRADGSVIEGLYVTGNDSGGYYSMTYPNLSTGNACGRTVTFGRMIAKNLAK